jgi:hypothetical protein
MKRIFGIGFYWGKTKILRLKLDKPELEWHMELYGISIKNTFVGIMVRGKRVTYVPEVDGASWENDRLRAEGAYDTGRDGWR